MSVIETPWNTLASRVIRIALIKGNINYADLVEHLNANGGAESERALVVRVARGTVRVDVLLQVMKFASTPVPAIWARALADFDTLESAVVAVLQAELSRYPWMTMQSLAARLRDMGVKDTGGGLVGKLSTGVMPLSLFLQCLAAMGSQSLDMYVSADEVANIYRATMPG